MADLPKSKKEVYEKDGVLRTLILAKLKSLRKEKFEAKSIDDFSLIFRVFILKYLNLNYEFTEEELASEMDKKKVPSRLKEKIMDVLDVLTQIKYEGKNVSRAEFRLLLDETEGIVHSATGSNEKHAAKEAKPLENAGLAGFLQNLLPASKNEGAKKGKAARQETAEKSKEEQKKKRKEELRKNREKEIEDKKQRELREQKEREKSKRLEEIKETEGKINGINSKIAGLREKISQEDKEINFIQKDASTLQKNIEGLLSEKTALSMKYNEGMKEKKELLMARAEKLAEWKQRYNKKINEKSSLAKEMQQIYKNELENAENELKKLSPKERAELEKWKRLKIKARHKLREKENEKKLQGQINLLLEEKKGIEREFNGKIHNALNGMSEKEAIAKQKSIDGGIRQQEKELEELKKNMQAKAKLMEKRRKAIEAIEEEKSEAKDELLEKRRQLGGISYLLSAFKLTRPPEPKKDSQKKAENLKHDGKKQGLEKGIVAVKSKLKNRKFMKCHNFLVKAKEALSSNDVVNAKKSYLKAKNIYAKLEYEEKKDMYEELNGVYNKLRKAV